MFRSVLMGVAICFSGCVYVDADVAKISQNLGTATFTASPTPGVMMTETQSIAVDTASQLASLFSEANVTEMKFLADSGVTSMDFIQQITVTAMGSGSVPNVTFAKYVKGTGMNSDGSLDATIETGFDQTPYLLNNGSFSLEVEAVAPTEAWAISVDVSLHASASKKLAP